MQKYEVKKCKHCNYRMAKLYRHINRKDVKKKWLPVIWWCDDCKKLGDRIKQDKKEYKEDKSRYNNKLSGEIHKKNKMTQKDCYKPLVKLYKLFNTKNKKGWFPVLWYCPYCDMIISRIEN
jgi:RNase P subunit RPR2